MLNKDYTAILLNLEDVMITNSENISEEIHIYIELPRKEHLRYAGLPDFRPADDRFHVRPDRCAEGRRLLQRRLRMCKAGCE